MQNTEDHIDKFDRRDLMKRAIYGIPLLIGGTITACVGNYLFGKQKAPASGWSDAGDISELQRGKPQQIRFDKAVVDGWTVRSQESSAWVVIDDKQKVTAFVPVCTHLGCAYGWRQDKKAFVCPCHGSVFSLQGDVITGPANRALDRFETKVEGNRLWLGPVTSSEGA